MSLKDRLTRVGESEPRGYDANQDFEFIREQATEILETDPNNRAANYQLGMCLEAEGDERGAISAFEKALDCPVTKMDLLGGIDLDDGIIKESLIALYGPENSEKALRLHESIRGNPGEETAYWLKEQGDLLALSARTNEARVMYGQAIERDPNQVGAYIELAQHALNEGDMNEAKRLADEMKGKADSSGDTRAAYSEIMDLIADHRESLSKLSTFREE